MNEQSYLQDVQGSWGVRGFTMGVILGAGIALLLAPAPGAETRKKIGDTAKRIGTDARHRLDSAKHTVGTLKNDAKAAVDAGRDAYTRSRQSHQAESTQRVGDSARIQSAPPARSASTRPL